MRFLTAVLLLVTMIVQAHADKHTALQILVKAYPQFLERIDGNDLVWRDGTRMPISDGQTHKSFDQLLNAPDIDDQFNFSYPLGVPKHHPRVNQDPGRIRYEPLFNKMYGDCLRSKIRAKFKPVVWLPKHDGRRLNVTTVNGVADKLAKISRELDALPKRFMKYLVPLGGTYNCRKIAGTKRKSVHAFGAAIDINVKHAHYWRWTKVQKGGRIAYRNRVPFEIVKIFERHGFIWGGKWYHYDTMHFEYRPELIALAKKNISRK